MDRRISVHHIGGRGGSRRFPIVSAFEKDVVNVLYDADKDSVAKMKEAGQNLESELHVLPYCVGDACRSTSFYLNTAPETSSLFEENPVFRPYTFYLSTRGYDFIWSELNRLVEKRTVEMVTMDSIFGAADNVVPPPNFLSIDAQGAEYDILVGAKNTLKSGVVALVMEVEFRPIYKGAHVFGEVSELLTDQGFHFVKLRDLDMYEMYPYRAPIGLRGEGFHTLADALFFRRIDDIIESVGDRLESSLMLRKLAFIAVLYNQIEYALECLRRSRSLVQPGFDVEKPDSPVYQKFLVDFQRVVEKVPQVYPAKKSRFEGLATPGKQQVSPDDMKRYTDVDTVLTGYGLTGQAELLKKKRAALLVQPAA